MKPQPLSLHDAQLLCEESQRLVGRPLNPQIHAHGSIERVVVVPYGDPQEQRAYVESLLHPQNSAGVASDSAECGFAVLVVGKPKRWLQHAVLFQDVRTYLRKHVPNPFAHAKNLLYRHSHHRPEKPGSSV